MHLVRHMKSSTSESKSNFCRSIRLAQSNRTAGRPKYKSVDPNWFIRRSLHAPNQMIRFGSCKVRRMNRALCTLFVFVSRKFPRTKTLARVIVPEGWELIFPLWKLKAQFSVVLSEEVTMEWSDANPDWLITGNPVAYFPAVRLCGTVIIW